MTKQELQPDQKEEQNAQQLQNQQEKWKRKVPTPDEEIQDAYRRLEKARNILYTAGNVGVGETPNEILVEKRAYRLLHYQQRVNRTARTPILVVYALINKSILLIGSHQLQQINMYHLMTMSTAISMIVLRRSFKRTR
jgi:poly(3-hydroxyalkanoate) synthetase